MRYPFEVILHTFQPISQDVGSQNWTLLWDQCLVTRLWIPLFFVDLAIRFTSRFAHRKAVRKTPSSVCVLRYGFIFTADSTCHGRQFAYSLLTCPLLGHGTGWNIWPRSIGWFVVNEKPGNEYRIKLTIVRLHKRNMLDSETIGICTNWVGYEQQAAQTTQLSDRHIST